MFSSDVFTTNVDIAWTIHSTAIVCIVFIGMIISYTNKRTGQHYSKNRLPAPSIRSFRLISKLLFVASMILTISGFWFDSPIFITLYENAAMQTVGALIVLVGFINLKITFKHLGDHYSPSFDAYIPSGLVISGNYRLVRHPIYLFNLFVSFGLAIASGSLVVMVSAIVGLIFILKTIVIEEAYLSQHFALYKAYTKSTWRLLPFCY